MACWGSNRSDSRGRSPRAIKLQVFYWEHLFPIFLALFDTFWLFHPKYGLLGLKSLGFARAFISRDKIWRFLAGTPFSYFFLALFVTFWLFLCKTALFSSFLPLPRQTNDKFGNFFSNFQGFTLVPWQKVGRICSKCLLYNSQILFFPLPVNERYDTEFKKPMKTPVFLPF